MDISRVTSNSVKIIECPRDAMQGWKTFIPTDQKVAYIDSLLRVGFDTIDCGSFVSPKAMPQMSDTKDVLSRINPDNTISRLLVIVANKRGAEEAAGFEMIDYLGFPFSISETFQQRNTNSSISESFQRVQEIQEICVSSNKELVVYISMGFGNPYGDPYSENIVFDWVHKIASLGIKTISLADTVGLATPVQVRSITEYVIEKLPGIEIGVHLHSSLENWTDKLEAAFKAGCNRYDGALKGIGGCPMANNELVGNMNTELMVAYFAEQGISTRLDHEALAESLSIASQIFKS